MLRRLLLVSVLLLLTATGGVAAAAEPPNQNDPCSRNGRDTCGTTGKGSYRDSRYGVRWFGDYRGAVPDVAGGTFCIDLRFWYPSKAFGYEERSAEGLKNRGGKAVSATSLRRMNRALWRYGRSGNAAQQAAVMLYVHRLMGDGAAGEVDPKALSSASQSVYAKVVADAERWAGPYTVAVTLPAKLTAGKPAEATVEVLTASGRKLPDVDVALTVAGAEAPKTVNAGDGTAKLDVTAGGPGSVTLDARTEGIPAELPTLYSPTKGAAVANGQRLVSAASVTPRAAAQAVAQAQPALATQISQQSSAPGAAITDTVKVTGLGGLTATIQAALYGPYPTREAITCADAPVWTGTVAAAGDGDYVTEPVTLTVPGYYTYRESIAESAAIAGVQTACADAAETTIVRAAPQLTTQISAQQTAPGAQITDSVLVSGLGKIG